MKWWLVLALAAAPVVSERTLFEALGARELPGARWLSVPEARARAAEEDARLKLKRALGHADREAERALKTLTALIERRAAATGIAPPPPGAPGPAPRPLFGATTVQVLVCRYRGGLDPHYHRAGCARLRGIVSALDLTSARKTCTPCPACRGG